MKNKNVDLLVGAQWGDEGKGKVVDLLGADVDVFVRSQGGANAGHTVIVDGQKVVFHLLPSGMLYPGKLCVLGNGLVIDPEQFLKETSELDVLERNRRADYVRARVVLCFVAKQEGFSQHEVGKALGLNHSTVCYHEKVMNKALSLPGQYADYINLYNKFTNAILCQNN